MEHAPIDSNIKTGISGAADLVEGQADADPDAGAGERVASGVGKNYHYTHFGVVPFIFMPLSISLLSSL